MSATAEDQISVTTAQKLGLLPEEFENQEYFRSYAELYRAKYFFCDVVGALLL